MVRAAGRRRSRPSHACPAPPARRRCAPSDRSRSRADRDCGRRARAIERRHPSRAAPAREWTAPQTPARRTGWRPHTPSRAIESASPSVLSVLLMAGLKTRNYIRRYWVRLGCQRAAEEDVVLEVNVFHQLLFELLQAAVQRAPRGAGLGGRGEIARQGADAEQITLVVLVLQLQHVNRRRDVCARAADDGGKED